MKGNLVQSNRIEAKRISYLNNDENSDFEAAEVRRF